MTAHEMQDIARKLSNTAYCRYWLNWPGSDGIPRMAISLIQIDDADKVHYQQCADLERMGFSKEIYCGGPLYVITRTDNRS